MRHIDSQARFNTLAGGSRGYNIEEPQVEPESLDPREAAIVALRPWASGSACQKYFLPYLDGLIAQAETQETANVDSHARMVEAMAQKNALKLLREDFEFWAGQRTE